MNGFPGSMSRLVEQFCKMPGIGMRSAQRMAFHVLRSSREDVDALSKEAGIDGEELTEEQLEAVSGGMSTTTACIAIALCVGAAGGAIVSGVVVSGVAAAASSVW